MRHLLRARRARTCLLFVVLAFSASISLAQNSLDQFESQLDATIRSACHGYVIDFIPEVLSWLRDDIYEGSPFCVSVQGADTKADLIDAMKRAPMTARERAELADKNDPSLRITIQCDSEYMCMETRLKFRTSDTPVSMDDYVRVRDFCDERYACIEQFFMEWPRELPASPQGGSVDALTLADALPEPKPTAQKMGDQGMSDAANPFPEQDFQSFVNFVEVGRASKDPLTDANETANKNEASDPAAGKSSSEDQTKNQKGVEVATTQGQSTSEDILIGPLLPYTKALAYCEARGMKVPTYEEARSQLTAIREWYLEDSFARGIYGTWTTDQSSTDRMINNRRTMTGNGYSNGFPPSQDHLTVCFPR